MKILPASELKPPPIEWLWPGYLAVGNLTMLDGDPGLGKSLITLDVAARITTGRPFPDGARAVAPAAVLLVCCEDPDGVIIARLRALGADLTHIYIWPRDQGGGLPHFPKDIPRLDAVLDNLHARYVVFDPIVSYVQPNINLGCDASVRVVLDGLAQCAARHQSAFQLLRHLNKKTSQPSLYRGGGSIAFIAASRLAWLAAQHPRQPDHCVLAQNKNNYAPLHPSLLYSIAGDDDAAGARIEDGKPKMEDGGSRIEDGSLRMEGGGKRIEAAGVKPISLQSSILDPPCSAQVSDPADPPTEGLPPPPADEAPAHIVWHGPCPLPAAVLAARRPSPALLRAIAFLKDALQDGPRLVREVRAAAERQGISYGTLRRAKDLLFIESPRRYDHDRPLAYYKFPHQRLPPSPGCELADAYLEGLAEEWRSKAG